MKRSKLVLSGTIGEGMRKQPMEFFRAGFLLVAAAALLLLFPQFRRPWFFIIGGLLAATPFALSLYFRPWCIAEADCISIRRGRRTVRSIRLDDLTAIGRCQENDAPPQLFLCTTSRKELLRFAYAHERDCAIVAKHYGYSEQRTEAEQWRVILTVYLWRKGSISNPNVAKISLKKNSWEKLAQYCSEKQLELQDIIVHCC